MTQGANEGVAEYKTGAVCDQCEKKMSAGDAWSCPACHYDLCNSCYQPLKRLAVEAHEAELAAANQEATVTTVTMDSWLLWVWLDGQDEPASLSLEEVTRAPEVLRSSLDALSEIKEEKEEKEEKQEKEEKAEIGRAHV